MTVFVNRFFCRFFRIRLNGFINFKQKVAESGNLLLSLRRNIKQCIE